MPHTPGHTSWDEASSAYQQDWQSRSGSAGGRWEDAEPGYRYGHEMAGEERYSGREFSDAEADLRGGYSDWSRERGYHREDGGEGENVWDRIKDGVKDAWEKVRGK